MLISPVAQSVHDHGCVSELAPFAPATCIGESRVSADDARADERRKSSERSGVSGGLVRPALRREAGYFRARASGSIHGLEPATRSAGLCARGFPART